MRERARMNVDIVWLLGSCCLLGCFWNEGRKKGDYAKNERQSKENQTSGYNNSLRRSYAYGWY